MIHGQRANTRGIAVLAAALDPAGACSSAMAALRRTPRCLWARHDA